MKPVDRGFLRYLLAALWVMGGCAAPKPDDWVARWNQTAIVVADFSKELKRRHDVFLPDESQSKQRAQFVKRKILDDLIDRKLLLQEAQKQGIQVEPEELAQEIRKFKSNYTEISFQKMLKERDFTPEEWADLKRENLMITKYLESLSPAEATAADVDAYYQAHSADFQVPESVHVRQIVTDTKEKAETILKRLQNGENFAKLAQDLSLSPDRNDGGDLGFIQRGSFPREFEVCFSMKPGEISPIIPSLYGFHIFKILEKAPPHALELEEVREKIELTLQQDRRQVFVKEHLKTVREQAKIEINEKILERVQI